jgi:hypothetical protein
MQGDGHGECKTINTPHGHSATLLDNMGGFTLQVQKPGQLGGLVLGRQACVGTRGPGKHVSHGQYGQRHHRECRDGICSGAAIPETTPWGFTGQFASRLCYFWAEVGIKQIYICPDLNYGAAVHADKWIPVLPNTDSALQLAIAHVWITEDLI